MKIHCLCLCVCVCVCVYVCVYVCVLILIITACAVKQTHLMNVDSENVNYDTDSQFAIL